MANRGKNLTCWLLLILLGHLCLFKTLSAFEKGKRYPRYYFSFSYYAGNIGVGDLNACLTSFNDNDLFKYIRENKPPWGEIEGEIQPLSGKYKTLEIGLYINMNPKLSLSITTFAPVKRNNNSSLKYYFRPDQDTQIMSYYFEPKYELLFPVEFTLYYNLLHLNRLKFSIGAGSGFYYAKISRLFLQEEITPDGGILKATIKLDTRRLPFPDLVGNLNFLTEYSVGPSIFLICELRLRYGKISRFKGSGSLLYENNSDIWANDKRKGTLYFFNMEDQVIGARYNNIDVWSYIPDASIYFLENIRKASLDLTGFSLKIGLKIRLF
jgi:hypothetical protein